MSDQAAEYKNPNLIHLRNRSFAATSLNACVDSEGRETISSKLIYPPMQSGPEAFRAAVEASDAFDSLIQSYRFTYRVDAVRAASLEKRKSVAEAVTACLRHEGLQVVAAYSDDELAEEPVFEPGRKIPRRGAVQELDLHFVVLGSAEDRQKILEAIDKVSDASRALEKARNRSRNN